MGRIGAVLSPGRRSFPLLARGAGIVLFFLPLLYRAQLVEVRIFRATGYAWEGFFMVLAHDAAYYGVLLALGYVSLLRKIPRVVACAARATLLLGWGLYVADCVVFKEFHARPFLADLLKYQNIVGDYAFHFLLEPRWSLIGILLAGLVVLAGSICFFLTPLRKQKNQTDQEGLKIWLHGVGIGVPLAAIILTAAIHGQSRRRYVHSWMYRNLVDVNLSALALARDYTPQFRRRFVYTESYRCYQVEPSRPNIVLVIVESLSSFHSRWFSGLNDWTPHLDRLARDNISCVNFYANGFVSEDGEAALLTGRLPLHPPRGLLSGGGDAFQGFFHLPDALPRVLKQYGYRTEFLTSSELGFANMGPWARSLGFDHVEGAEAPFYASWPRFEFNAPPDEALYARALARIKQAKQPFFFCLVTSTSHHPFRHPHTRRRGMEACIRYVDEQLGKFAASLERMRFFDRGILVITADHRAMVPITRRERERFGPERAAARIPLVIVNGKDRRMLQGPFQQVDIPNSLIGLVSGQVCYSDWVGDLFHNHPPRYIVHREGGDRHIVSVFALEATYRVILDGDRTRLLNPDKLPPGEARRIVSKINACRLQKETRMRRFGVCSQQADNSRERGRAERTAPQRR